MCVLHYTRFAAATLACICGFVLLGCFGNALAAEQTGVADHADDFAILSAIALEEPVPSITPAVRLREPFNFVASAPLKDGVEIKWRRVKQRLPGEHAILMRCRAQPAMCPAAAKRFLAILDRAKSREGWQRIAEVNRAINLDITPVDDMTQYGVVDLWATPLMAFKSNEGDCEDYAIAKYVALHELGIPLSDLKLIVVHVNDTTQAHAVTAVRYGDGWFVLDNRTLEIRYDAEIRDYDPLFVMDDEGARRVIAWPSTPQTVGVDRTPAVAKSPFFGTAQNMFLIL
jgi:predicted transglutaminase-like cysteine proteinase